MQILVALTLPFIAVMNYFSQAGYFGDIAVSDLARRTGESIATPAGRAFAIWWLIYLGILCYVIYQFFIWKNKQIQQATPYIATNLIANGLRYYFSTVSGQVRVSALLIIIMWISLWYINKHLQWFEKGKWRKDILFVVLPRSIYFAWITVATPLNIGAALTDWWYTRAETSQLAVLSRTALSYITALVVFYRIKRASYMAVIIRALIAVAMARSVDTPSIAYIAQALIIISLIIVAYSGYKKTLKW